MKEYEQGLVDLGRDLEKSSVEEAMSKYGELGYYAVGAPFWDPAHATWRLLMERQVHGE